MTGRVICSGSTPSRRLNNAAFDTWLPVGAILAAVVLWGGSFTAMRIAVNALNPWSVMWSRMLVALVCLAPFLIRLVVRATYQPGDWKLLAAMVLFQPCFYFLLEAYALKFTTASQAGVIAASVPLLVAVGARLFLAEPLNRFTVGGVVISVAGVVLLTVLGAPQGQGANPLLGNTLELAAMACAAANFVLVKKLGNRYSPWSITALQVLGGALFFMPGGWPLVKTPALLLNGKLVMMLLYLGGFVTLGAFGLYYWGLQRMPASHASAFINLVPVVAVMGGWVCLQETLTFYQSLAALSVIAGVWLSQIKKAGRFG